MFDDNPLNPEMHTKNITETTSQMDEYTIQSDMQTDNIQICRPMPPAPQTEFTVNLQQDPYNVYKATDDWKSFTNIAESCKYNDFITDVS